MSSVFIPPTVARQELQTTTKLQNLVLPGLDICTVEELFLRLDEQCFLNYEDGVAELNQGGKIRFDTYFNAFSVGKWKNYTDITAINIKLCLKGRLKVKLLNVDRVSEVPHLISQKIITSPQVEEFALFKDINLQPYQGLLYLELEALENRCLFAGGHWSGTVSNDRDVVRKVALVICTYKREAYVRKNVHLLEQTILSQPDLKDQFEVFVIDNGRTLDDFSHPHVQVVPNKNAGGSGGYTRGILEVFKYKDQFSHILFLDDDVVITPEIFVRTVNFLRVINNEDLCLGGSMLRLDNKYVQHENGAAWDKVTIRLKPDLDLRNVNNILFNEIEEYVNYNGWWFFCFPLKLIDEFHLPYPFFIKLDDMEFPLRLKYSIVTLNGICVWHEPLENKYSPIINYYFRRNEMILNCLVSDDFGRLQAIKWLIKFTLRESFCYRYQSANLVLMAIADFLRGPHYLKELDPELKNLEILSMGEKAVKNPDAPFMYDKYQHSMDEQESSIHRWFRFATFNGHLLPKFLFHSDNRMSESGYRIAPIQGYRPLNVFRAKKVLYYNLIAQEGFVVQFSRSEFFKLMLRAIALCFEVWSKFASVKQQYRETLPELTNQTFWENYLEVDKYSN